MGERIAQGFSHLGGAERGNKTRKKCQERKVRCGPFSVALRVSARLLSGGRGETESGGRSLAEFGRGRRHSGVNLRLDSHLQHSITVPESCGPSKMIALSPSIRPADRINPPLLLGSLPPTAPLLVCILTQPRYPSVALPHAAVNPLIRALFSRNVPNIIKVRWCLPPPPSEPGTAAARRKLCFGGKLVSWHVISQGEFLIRDLVEICQSPGCYRFSILSPGCSHLPPAPFALRTPTPCLPSGSALRKKGKRTAGVRHLCSFTNFLTAV